MELLGKYQRLYGISPVLCFGITDGQVRADEYSFFFSGVRSIFEKNNKDIAESLEGRTGVRNHVKEVLVGLGTDKKEAEKTADDFARFAVDIAYKSKDMKFEFYNAEKVDAKEMEKLKFDIKSFEKGMQIENPYGYCLYIQ